MADVDRQFEQARQDQQRLFEQTLAFSPVTLTYQALATIAGNDGARHQRFLAEVQQHQQGLRDYFQRVIQLSALGDERKPCPTTCLGGYGFRDFDQVPTFAPSPALAGLTEWRQRLLSLPLWTAIMLALAALLLARTVGRRQG